MINSRLIKLIDLTYHNYFIYHVQKILPVLPILNNTKYIFFLCTTPSFSSSYTAIYLFFFNFIRIFNNRYVIYY